jgi:predicted TIM-barrel fold metal-dependent hydrolase
MNKYCASLRDDKPDSYGFFATVPLLENSDLALPELRYAFDTLHADGVTLFIRYGKGDGYLGHKNFVPIGEELNKRKAVVFVHPVRNKNPHSFNDTLIMPAFDWPHETGRTAIDMIFNKRLIQFPDVKIILSHAGGTLPLLAKWSTLMSRPEYGGVVSADEIMSQAKNLYFDLAISGSSEVLPLVLDFAKKGHVLLGSDYPHGTASFSQDFTKFIDEYPMDEETRNEVYFGAAKKLLPRLNGTLEQ